MARYVCYIKLLGLNIAFGKPSVIEEASQSKQLEKRSGNTTWQNPADWLLNWLGIATGNEVIVTPKNSIQLTAVYAANRIIAETLSTLPIQVIKRDGNTREQLYNHPVYQVLNEPNLMHTGVVWRELMQTNLNLWGNAFAIIYRDNSERPIELLYVPAECVTVFKYQDRLWYRITGISQVIPSEDMLHLPMFGFDGICGISPIRAAADSIGIGISSQRYGRKFFEKGAILSGVLSVPGKLTQAQRDEARQSWQEMYGGAENSGSVAVLDNGAKFEKISVPPEEAQFIESRQFSVEEIARIYRIPPHKLADLAKSTNNNIEQQAIEFITDCILPMVSKWEAELNRKLFYESEKGSHYVKFNINGLLRGDTKTRSEFYKDMLDRGVFSINEVRELEDKNPIENGDVHFVPLNMTTLDRAVNNTQNPQS